MDRVPDPNKINGALFRRSVPALYRSYIASSEAGMTRTPPTAVMKFVSPFQRGMMCTCRWLGTPAPAARPMLIPMLSPWGSSAARASAAPRSTIAQSVARWSAS